MTSPEQQHTGGLRGAINDLLGRGRDERGGRERDDLRDDRLDDGRDEGRAGERRVDDDGLGAADRLDRSGAEDAGVTAPGGPRHGGADDAGVPVPGRASGATGGTDVGPDPALDRTDPDDLAPGSEPRHSLREPGPDDGDPAERDLGRHDTTAADAERAADLTSNDSPRTDRERTDMDRTDTELARDRGPVDGEHLEGGHLDDGRGLDERRGPDEGRGLDDTRTGRDHLDAGSHDTELVDGGGTAVDGPVAEGTGVRGQHDTGRRDADRLETDRLDTQQVRAGTADAGTGADPAAGSAATTTAGTAGTGSTAHAASGAGVAGSGGGTASGNGDAPARLVSADRADSYTGRWNEVKGMFVDEPRQAVGQADALVGELLDELQNLFTQQRRSLEHGLDNEETSTEDLRVALRRYRSFFDRLLSI